MRETKKAKMNTEYSVINTLDKWLALHLVVFSFVRDWANKPFFKCKMKLLCAA